MKPWFWVQFTPRGVFHMVKEFGGPDEASPVCSVSDTWDERTAPFVDFLLAHDRPNRPEVRLCKQCARRLRYHIESEIKNARDLGIEIQGATS